MIESDAVIRENLGALGYGGDWTEYGRISDRFQCKKLEEICVPKTGVQTGPFGSQLHKEDYVDNGTPIITVEHLLENRISHVDTPMVSDADRDRLKKYSLRTGDIVFSRVGSVDRRSLVREPEDGWLFSGRCLRVRADNEVIDPTYLSYFFGHEGFKNHIRSIAVGATMPSINTKILSEVPVYYPPLPEQKSIAHILGTLDHKIELNRQMNTTLEAMAQALFKSWFVDFDPVIDNALAAGNLIPEPLQVRAEVRAALGDNRHVRHSSQSGGGKPLPEAIQKQFPSGFVFSEEMGWVPEGWGCGSFRDISKHVKDGVKAEDVANYDFYIGLEHIGRKQIFLAENGTGESIESNKSGFGEGDLLFGKLRPYFHKVCIAPQEGICSTDILVFRPCKPEFRSYMYLSAYTVAFVEYANMRSTGTRMPRASAKDMLDYVIVAPSEAVLNSFEKMTAPFWEKGMEAVGCSRALASLRDTLLPKLLSGQLRIPDAEKLVAEVG